MRFREFFRSKPFRVMLCIVALLTGVMLYSIKQGGKTDLLTDALQNITYPVRRFSAGISNSVDQKLDTYYNAKAYREENAMLRQQITDLNEKLIGYDDAVAELEALRAQLQIQEENSDFVMSRPATVLLPLTNDLSEGFLIHLGTEDGVTLNAPVICSQGLVGIITEVSSHYATVTTILSDTVSVGALVPQSNDSGIIEGNLHLAADGNTKLIYLNEQHNVTLGDLVITAGETGLFPYGLQIGNVTEIGMEETGLTAYAVVKPSVDFSTLTSVTVLLDFEGKGENLS